MCTFLASPCLPTCVTRMHTATPQPPQTALLSKVSEAFRKTLVGQLTPALGLDIAQKPRVGICPKGPTAIQIFRTAQDRSRT